jgi:hypothetical protein
LAVRGDFVEFPEAQRRFLVEIDLSGVHGSLLAGASLAGSLNLKRVRLPSTLIQIPGGFFRGCVRLMHVNLEECDGLEVIGSGAFQWCLKLSRVSIPPSCKHIGLSGTAVLALDLRGCASQVVEVTNCAWLVKLDLLAGGVRELLCHFCPRLSRMSLGRVAGYGWTLTVRPSEVRYLSRCGAGVENSVSACAFLCASVFGEVTALGRREGRPALAP